MRASLNGYWDICPLFAPDTTPGGPPPHDRYIRDRYIVPSVFANAYEDLGQGMWNSFDYPDAWNSTKDAWLRKVFVAPEAAEDDRIELRFAAVLGESLYWLNGVFLGSNADPNLPVVLDVTEHIRTNAENELLVRVKPPRTDSSGKYLVPVGGFIPMGCAGIWQGVELRAAKAVRVADFLINTDLAASIASIVVTVENRSADPFAGSVLVSVAQDTSVIQHGEMPVQIASGESVHVSIPLALSGIRLWSAEHPVLYDLACSVGDPSGQIVDRVADRQGFRQIEIREHSFYVNGIKTHLYGDWGHRVHALLQRPEYLRAWFSMLKDLGMNYVRLHTGPHDPATYRIANEVGIYVCAETALFGSAAMNATGEDAFWTAAYDHVHRLVRRDRHETCLIMWSVGNEMRWNPPIERSRVELPRLGDAMRNLDATRPIYFEGDSSLWIEDGQQIISRHYGYDTTGEGWWDKNTPLHVGELGKWHYGQPPENVMIGGPGVYESLWKAHESVGREAAMLVERARINDVSSINTWNVCCLDNPAVPDIEARGVFEDEGPACPAPARVPRLGSEFVWWSDAGSGYRPGPSFTSMLDAFNPETFFIWERLTQYFTGATIGRRITVINDTEEPGDYEMVVWLTRQDGDVITEHRWRLTVGPGERGTHALSLRAPDVPGEITIVARLSKESKPSLVRSQTIVVHDRAAIVLPPGSPEEILLYGEGPYATVLGEIGVPSRPIDGVRGLHPESIVLVQRVPGRLDEQTIGDLNEFIADGGRVVLTEYAPELLSGTALDKLDIHCAHAAIPELADLDLSWWGEDAVPGYQSGSFVAERGITKPLGGSWCSWIDVGTGDFGRGGLRWSGLLEWRAGKGVCLATTMSLATNALTIPAARSIICRMLEYTAGYQAARQASVWLGPGVSSDSSLRDLCGRIESRLSSADLAIFAADDLNAHGESIGDWIRAGGRAMCLAATPETLPLCRDLGVAQLDLIPHDAEPDGVVSAANSWNTGICNDDLFWRNRVIYSDPDAVDRPISNGWVLRDTGLLPVFRVTDNPAYHRLLRDYRGMEIYRSRLLALYLNESRTELLAGASGAGDGHVLFCQVPLPVADEPRSLRLWSRLLTNQRAARDLTPLDVAHREKGAPFPSTLHTFRPENADQAHEVVSAARNPERFETKRELLAGSWTEVRGDEGVFAFAEDHRLLLLSYVRSDRPRKLVEVVGGLPNPLHTLRLELHGYGVRAVHINGTRVASNEHLANPTVVVTEIELRQGLNSVVLDVEVPTGEELLIRWKNSLNEDEHDLHYE